MKTTPGEIDSPARDPFGTQKLTFVDRLGVWLSQRAISKYLPRARQLDVLELGCGLLAKNLVALRPRLRHGVGVDFRVADHVKSLERLDFIEATIDQASPSIGAASFDAILFISVLEHIDNPAPVLQRCREWLKPGGVLLVNVPTWRGKTFLEFSAFRLGLSPACEMDEHKMYYDKRDLWPLLVRAGFLPSTITMRYHKFGLNLFAAVRKP